MSFPESDMPRFAGVVIADRGQSVLWTRSATIQTMLLRVACALILFGILVAGLWPFHTPKNEVSWLSHGDGLLFGKHGSVVSAGPFEVHSQTGESGSLEIWLEPKRVRSAGTILAFYWPASRTVPFAMRQSLGDLKLERTIQAQPAKKAKIYIEDVFSQPKPVFVTISSGKTGTAVYVDGTLIKKLSNFRFSRHDLTGQLILGNAPETTDSWSGQVKGLAIYDRELPASEVAQHFRDWTAGNTNGTQPDSAKNDGVVARYTFGEGEGSVVHNELDSSTDLLIPERFFVLHEQFLERPWDEFRSDWNYWKNVGVNIGGFIPLGFFFRAYFSWIWKVKRATWLTIALGFAVSLTIEVLQAFLPTRDSGMTDLMTNTLGTAVGATLCAECMKYEWFGGTRMSSVLPLKEEDVELV